jgi:hypothetical protein
MGRCEAVYTSIWLGGIALGGVWDKLEPLHVQHHNGENTNVQIEQWPSVMEQS